jgi:hypothetical protein
MNARLLSVTVLAAALGAATVTFAPLLSAPAPEPKPQRWEYKVVLFNEKFTPTSENVSAEKLKEQADRLDDEVNALAKDGWEYAGPLVPGHGGYQYTVFRRFKP